MRIAFCIRGHIRDGLFTSGLKDFIAQCETDGHTIDLYCHTWNESEAKTSYKTLDRSHLFTVKEGLIYSYFKGHNLAKIIIENDLKVKIYGQKTGNVCKSSCPLIAWKRMWAGQFSIVSTVHESEQKYDLCVNTRYDFFTAPICYTPPSHLRRLIARSEKFAFKYPNYTKSIIGVDNFYVGTPNHMSQLVGDFYYNLDGITQQYPDILNQEELVYRHAHNIGLI